MQQMTKIYANKQRPFLLKQNSNSAPDLNKQTKTYHGMIGTPAFKAILMIPFRFNIAPTSSLLVL